MATNTSAASTDSSTSPTLSSLTTSTSSTSDAPPTTSSTTTVESTSSATSTTTTTETSTTIPSSTFTTTSTSVVDPPPVDSTTTAQSQTIIIVKTSTVPATTGTHSVSTSSGSGSVTSTPASLNTNGSDKESSGGGGLSTAGITAIAVVVPVVVVALLVFAGILLWRKRKQKKAAEEARRKAVEDYGFNPNNDPTLPAVASENGHEMAEDQSSGYRGWGAATASSRKMSTTLSGGHTQGQLSDVGSTGIYGLGGNSDSHSGDPLYQRRETMHSDDVGSLGQGPVAGAAAAGGMKRGPSNASSTYSAGNVSDLSDGPPAGGYSQSYEAYNPNNGFGYSQHGPYGDGTYGGTGTESNGMPIVRDVSARRNTRIQQPGNYPQGNSGISQNF